MNFKPSDRFEISSEVLAQEVNGETVLLDLKGDSYFGLNEMGTHIWQLLQAGENVRGLLASLSSEYAASEERIERDVGDLLEKLTQAGLLSVATR